MNHKIQTAGSIIILNMVFIAAFLSILVSAHAQEEVASTLRRYKDSEVITGYYEDYEVIPSRQRPLVSSRPGLNRIFPYSPTAARVRIRTRLADSHQGIKFYSVLRCEYCHAQETKDVHTVRGNLTCRQCHGGEPIAAIEHAYSPMNPIRRHAYVCAKCHEGATPSFATYVVHQPDPGSAAAQREFPVLYYAYWFMLALLVGTLAFFLPHTFLVGFREVLSLLKGKKVHEQYQSDSEDEIEAEAAEAETKKIRDAVQEDGDIDDAQSSIEQEPEDEITRVDTGDGRKDAERDDDKDGDHKD